MRWKLTIEYNGSEFSGWQRQDNAPSVQQAIEEAFYGFCQREIKIYTAGRTDAGVHARGQIAHFDLDYGQRGLTGYELVKAINAHLRSTSITILKAEEVSDDFHARFDAINKLYTYRVLERVSPPTIDHGLIWHVKVPLNIEAMRESAEYLLGEHDFTTFRDSQCQAKSPVRTLDRLDITEVPYDECGGREISFHLEARSFLHHQVRNIVGTLVLVGRGKWQAGDVKPALEARDRTKGGTTAPSDGLCLVRIDYP